MLVPILIVKIYLIRARVVDIYLILLPSLKYTKSLQQTVTRRWSDLYQISIYVNTIRYEGYLRIIIRDCFLLSKQYVSEYYNIYTTVLVQECDSKLRDQTQIGLSTIRRQVQIAGEFYTKFGAGLRVLVEFISNKDSRILFCFYAIAITKDRSLNNSTLGQQQQSVEQAQALPVNSLDLVNKRPLSL